MNTSVYGKRKQRNTKMWASWGGVTFRNFGIATKSHSYSTILTLEQHTRLIILKTFAYKKIQNHRSMW
jgi:hypothetical protein